MSKKIAFLCGSFHAAEIKQMISAASAEAERLGLTVEKIVRVPGSMEKPLAAARLLKEREIDGIVVLGIIERGETAHGRVMGDAVIRKLVDLQIEHDKPMGVGILGPEIFPGQIAPRLKSYAEAAVKALAHMLEE